MTHHAASSIHGEGPHVAVLVLNIDTQTGKIVNAATVSPNPAIHDARYRFAELARESGSSYADARRRLLEYVQTHESWVVPYLK